MNNRDKLPGSHSKITVHLDDLKGLSESRKKALEEAKQQMLSAMGDAKKARDSEAASRELALKLEAEYSKSELPSRALVKLDALPVSQSEKDCVQALVELDELPIPQSEKDRLMNLDLEAESMIDKLALKSSDEQAAVIERAFFLKEYVRKEMRKLSDEKVTPVVPRGFQH
jgi:hypothetical protein